MEEPMATLNIKNFPDDLHRELRKQAEQDHRSLARHVIHLLRLGALPRPRKKHSILELEGLGEEIWKGVDAAEYVKQERDSWD